MHERPRFIAEVSSNHHASLERCLAFVDCAADVGCDAVKFQLFRVRELFAPEILERSAQHRAREGWELPAAFLPEIATRAHARGLEFACTPFSLTAVEELAPFVDFYKIASYELLWLPLLEACAKQGRPVVLSTGMADESEIERALRCLDAAGASEIALLHCVSGYPTPPADANLAAIETLRALAVRTLGRACEVGWSDHSVSPGVVQRAIHRFGASIVEFHLDIDGAGDEYATGHCWLPDAIARVIRDVRDAAASDGDGAKRPSACEIADRIWRADPQDGLRPLREIRETWRPQG